MKTQQKAKAFYDSLQANKQREHDAAMKAKAKRGEVSPGPWE